MAAAPIEALLAALRAAARPNAWSRGVEMARRGTAQIAWSSGDEAIVQVPARAGALVPTVRLYLDGADWDCDACEDVEACEHAVAAALAVEAAGKDAAANASAPPDSPLPANTDRPVAAVGYRFERTPTGLVFRRVLVRGGSESPLEPSLAVRRRAGSDAEPVAAGTRDLEIERAMAGWRGGTLPRDVIPRLFPLLAGEGLDVRLDGQPVSIGAAAVEPLVARVEDLGSGFRLSVVRNPLIDEFFGAAVRCGPALRPIAEIRLTLREREQLPRGRLYPEPLVAELVTEVLPSLAQRIPVEILTKRLPGAASVPPRVLVETGAGLDGLHVRASIVYGRPAIARLEDGHLVRTTNDPAQPIPVRDIAAEAAEADRLRRQLDLVPGREESFGGEAAVAFAARLARWDGEVRGDAHTRYVLMPPLVPRVAARAATDDASSVFDVAFEAVDGEGRTVGRADAKDVVAAWQRGAEFAPLAGGGWSPLPADWLHRLGPLAADLLAARRTDGTVPPSLLPDLARLCAAEGLDVPPAFERLRVLVESFDALPVAPLPHDLRATLRPYQQRGVDWLHFLRRAGLGGLLADDMGLGKTLQALAVFEGRVLVVCPASVLFNWEHEIARFRPGLRVHVYHGGQRALPEGDGDAVVLTTYALLRADADVLAAERWDIAVLDEAQQIKNPDSQVARAAFRLDAAFRLALTGTPVENRLEELWSLFRFVEPGLLASREHFDTRFARPIAAGDSAATARLRERLRPFVLRRLKRDVAPELPPRIEVEQHVDLSDSERTLYDAVRAATRDEVAALIAGGGSVMAVLEALLRLRQAACHPALVPGSERHAAAGGEPGSSAKLDALLELLETALDEGHKALVFSQWTSLLDLVEPLLGAHGIAFARLDGSTVDRGAVVGSFQDPDGPPVLLISLKAGGVGLNLTAADHVVLLDPWWNPAVEDQAIDRAHRIGQDRPVLVHRLVAKDTVEERLLALQESKRALADAALGGAASDAGTLTREDLARLLA